MSACCKEYSIQEPYKSRSTHKFCRLQIRFSSLHRSCCTKRQSIGVCKFRRTSDNTTFHDAHSKCSPYKTVPDVIPLILAVLEGCVSPRLLGIAECLRAPVLANVSQESGLVLREPNPRATKTEDVRFQAAFAVQPGRNGLLNEARKHSAAISQTCPNTSRDYESEAIWAHWHLPCHK
jgi:hypothetical protein